MLHTEFDKFKISFPILSMNAIQVGIELVMKTYDHEQKYYVHTCVHDLAASPSLARSFLIFQGENLFSELVGIH